MLPRLAVPPRPVGNAELNRDPTQTLALRTEFVREMERRFRAVMRLVWETVAVNDALGVGEASTSLLLEVQQAQPARAFPFPTSAGKVEAFGEWLDAAMDAEILTEVVGPLEALDPKGRWTSKYIERSYRKGVLDADNKLAQVGIETAGKIGLTPVSVPLHADALELLYLRAYDGLDGITNDMSLRMGRTLAEGFTKGLNPRALATTLNRDLGIGLQRARVLARTEIVRAHAESTLNRFEQSGIKEVQGRAEFATAGDTRVCPDCDGLEGQVYPLKDARGVIPVHPQCRCAWLPVLDLPQQIAADAPEWNDITLSHTAMPEDQALAFRANVERHMAGADDRVRWASEGLHPNMRTLEFADGLMPDGSEVYGSHWMSGDKAVRIQPGLDDAMHASHFRHEYAHAVDGYWGSTGTAASGDDVLVAAYDSIRARAFNSADEYNDLKRAALDMRAAATSKRAEEVSDDIWNALSWDFGEEYYRAGAIPDPPWLRKVQANPWDEMIGGPFSDKGHGFRYYWGNTEWDLARDEIWANMTDLLIGKTQDESLAAVWAEFETHLPELTRAFETAWDNLGKRAKAAAAAVDEF